MAEKTSTDDGVLYRAYKFRLDPNQAQKTELMRCVGAARHTYNLLTTYNLQILQNKQEYRNTRAAEGADHETINGELKKLREKDPAYQILYKAGYKTGNEYVPGYRQLYLTPEIKRHRAASKAIAAGADPAVVWPETEQYSEPWLHNINSRVLDSGLLNAGKAWKNYKESLMHLRAGARMGVPRRKRKGVSRDSFTVDSDRHPLQEGHT